MRYVKVFNEYLRTLGEIAFDELVRRNKDVVLRVRTEETRKWDVVPTSKDWTCIEDVRGDDS